MIASCKTQESKKKARSSIKSHVLGMNDDLWDKFHGLGSETWKGCEGRTVANVIDSHNVHGFQRRQSKQNAFEVYLENLKDKWGWKMKFRNLVDKMRFRVVLHDELLHQEHGITSRSDEKRSLRSAAANY